ncbi:MAG TPA: hypothetical protein H9830_12245, partial [Candidatus Agrococcus pullicola]|nr:hypothetical protein [Candidatus Agrococcus pullicola]
MRQYAETGLVALDLANTWDEYLENPERLPDLTALERFLKELGGERSDLRLRASDLEAVRAVRDRLCVVLGSVLEERTSALARWVSDAAPGVLVLEVEGAPRLRPTVKRGAGLADRLAVRAMAELLDLA